ncbi:MAG: hypothetical protein QOF41_2299 [Methylobacteriaceae bacterium]|nr:hypothetical protein [Methylobacteriaceae bacterium]
MANTLSATQSTTLLTDVDGDAVASSGDTLQTHVTITNTSSAPATTATGVSLSENLVNQTLVGGSVTITPIAVDDTGPTLVGNTPITFTRASLLANDLDPDGSAGSLTASIVAGSGNHGTIVDNGDGTYTFTPTTGFAGTATFQYRVTDSQGLLSNEAATVSLTVTDPTWYVDSANAGVQDGSFGHAFTTVGAAVTAAANNTQDAANGEINDTIFVYNEGATYSQAAGVTLATGEQLLGDGSALVSVNGHAVGVSTSNASFTVTGNSTDAVTLGSGNTVSGLNISETGTSGRGIVNSGNSGTLHLSNIGVSTTGSGISLTGGGTVDATTVGSGINSITSSAGTALNVSNTTIGASGLTFHDISSSNAASGIILNTTGSSGGLTVTGDGGSTNNHSGGQILGSTGPGVSLNSTSNVSLGYMNIQNGTDDGIHGENVNNFTLNRSIVSNNGNSTTDDGIQFGLESGNTVGVTGTFAITNSSVSGNAHNNVHMRDTSGTISSFTVTNSSFNDLNDTTGANSFLLEASGTSTITAGTISGSTFQNNSPQRGLEVQAHDTANIGTSTGNGGLNVTGNTFIDNGIQASFTQDGSANLTFRFENNGTAAIPMTGSILQAVNVFSSSTSTGGNIFGTISGNHIGNAAVAGSGSTQGQGISVLIQGQTDSTLLVDSNVIRQVGLTTGSAGISLDYRGATATGLGLTSLNDVTVTNNDVQTNAPASTFPLAAIFIRGDNQGSPAQVRANVHGNTVPTTGTWDYPSFDGNGAQIVYVNAAAGAVTQLVDNAPASANATAELQSSNSTAAGRAFASAGVTLIAGPINTPPASLLAGAGGVEAAINSKLNPFGTGTGSNPTDAGSAPSDSSQPGGPTSAPAASGTISTALTQADLDPIVAQAIANWEATGLTPDQDAYLRSVSFSVSDLGGVTLGSAQSGHVRLDNDAAGRGWYVDSNPADASEFPNGVAPTDRLTDPSLLPAGHIDLLTTIEHELGHELGLDDTYAPGDSASLMYGYIVDGERRAPAAGEAAGGTPGNIVGEDFLVAPITSSSFTLPAARSVTVTYNTTVDAQTNQLIQPATAQGTASATSFTSATTSPVTTTPIEHLTLGDLIFNDVNRNGVFDAGDTGINGVALTLFADNGTTPGSFDAGDAQIATTTTAGGGLYSFSNLAPGDYIVRIDSANFTSPGVLAAYRATTTNAGDPDTTGGGNINNDSNGGPIVAGSGVVTQAITLSYDGEPTVDPTQGTGTQHDINTTLDIGLVQNAAPVLDNTIHPSLTTETEDAPAPTNGSNAGSTLVSAIVDLNPPPGGADNVTDADDTVTGLAITGVSGGTLYYSTDDGATWTAVTTPSDTHALLLAADTQTRIYLQPTANLNGTISAVSFRAWDQTAGTAGTYTNVSTNGGISAFSSATGTANLSIIAVNDAPVASGSATLTAINEDDTNPPGATVSSLFSGNFSDAADNQTASGGSSANNFAGVAVTANGSSAVTGTWQYSTNSGGSWIDVGTVSAASALVLATDVRLRFVPAANYNGAAPGLTTHLIDDSAGAPIGATTGVDVSLTGGTTQYSSATVALGETILAVNDPPVLDLDANDSTATGSNYATLYTGTAVAIADTDVGISDVDNTTLASATITITNHQTNDLLSVNGALPGNITASAYNPATGVLTLTSAGPTATLAQWQTALHQVQFSNTGPTPNTTTRDVTVVVNDGTDNSNIAHAFVTLDQPPTLSVTTNNATFTESASNPASSNNTPVAPISASNPSDPDGGNLAGATISISSGFFAGDVLGFTSTATITGSYNSGTGMLTLTGSDSFANYQAALNSVTYTSTSDNPTDFGSDTSRTVSFTVSDGSLSSSPATATLTVAGANDAPAIGGVSGIDTAYTEQAAAVALDSGVTVSDVDSTTLGGASVSITGGLQAGDTLHFTDQNGITGTYDSGTGVLSLSGTASVADYQTALESVTFDNTTNDNPTNFGANTTRTVTWQVDDGSGAGNQNLSNTPTSTITITPVNDAPVVGGVTGVNTAYTEQASAVPVDGGVTVTDADSANIAGASVSITSGFQAGDTLHFTDTATITHTYNAATGVLTLSGTDTVANYQTALDSVTFDNTTNDNPTNFGANTTRTVTWQVDDGSGAGNQNLSNAPTSTITITPVNDAPVVGGVTGVNTAYTEQAAALAVDSGVTVSDADSTDLAGASVSISGGFQAGDTLHFTDTATITHTYNAATGVLTLSGTDTVANYQTALDSVTFDNTTNNDPTNGGANTTRTVTWQVDDGSGVGNQNLSNGPTSTITISAVDDGPANTVPVAQSVNEDTNLVFSSANSNAVSTSDPDNPSGTEQVTLSVGHGALTLSQTTGLAFTTGDGTSDATMTFTGTVANVNAALNGLSYLGNSNYNGPDSLTILTSDQGNTGSGGPLSDQDSVAITVNAVNDAPVLSGLGDTPSFVENGSPVVLDTNSNASVSDVELDASLNNYAGATLTLARNGGANPDDVFGSVGSLDLTDSNGDGENVSLDGGATFIGTYTQPGDGSILFTFNANATAADVDSVMRQITYQNTSDNPPSSAQIDFTFDDGNGELGGQAQGSGGAGITTASITVAITQIDDPPSLVNVSPSAAYAPGSTGVALSPGLGVGDPDATPPSPITGIHSGTVQIASGFFAGDELFVNLASGGGHFVTPDNVTTNISASYAAGTLTLSGTDTVQDYQAVLDAVSYRSTAADPSNLGADPNRTITWEVSDGVLDNQAATPPIYPQTLLHFDVAPVVDLDGSNPGTGYTTTYTTSTPPIPIVNNDSVTDPDTANADSMTIVLTNAMAGDALSIAGSLPGGIASSIDTSVAGRITLRLFNSASLADYQTALSQVRFANSSVSPNTTDRDITVVLSETDVDSNTAHATVHVVDATPPAKPPAPDLTTATDSGVSHTDNVTNVTAPTFTGNVEPGTTVRLYDSDGTTIIGTGAADAQTGAYTITSSTLSQGTHHLTVTSTDASNNASVHSDALDVRIDTTAPAPTLTAADATTTFRNSVVHYTLSFPETTFGVDAGDFTLTQSGGASGAAITAVSEPGGPGTPYTISVSTGTGLGTLQLSLNSSGTGITDAAGNAAGGASGPAYTVTNRSPVAHNDIVTLAATQNTLSGNVLSNDSDPDGDALRVTSVSDFLNGVQQQVAVPASGSVTLQSNHGAFTISADGSYTFTANDARPVQNHYAEDPLLYSISDGFGGTANAQLDVNFVGQQRPSTETFNFNFVSSTVTYGPDGEAYLTGPDGVMHNVTGVGLLVFNDGRINEADSNQTSGNGGPPPGGAGSALVDDLYYDSQYHDVYLAGIDPEAHYAANGWHEGRNPDPYFNTNYYLSQNPDVAAAHINPLSHYDTFGWREGRNPSANFSTTDYELSYPDVAASGVDPLAQYLSVGELQNRVIFPANAGTDGPVNGFDPTYYLANNPDVAAAHVNPLQHYLQYGWHEGRNPSADFNTNFYESHNPDVAAAGIDPLIHYDQFGWHEGRDPAAVFSTNGYLTGYPDVAAANINPLQHFLQFGMAEGRSPTG